MYSIVALSIVGILKKDNRFTDYVLALAIPGVALELYHYSIQKIIVPFTSCGETALCTATQAVDYFGFMTIPFLCLVAFIVITILAGINTYMEKKKSA